MRSNPWLRLALLLLVLGSLALGWRWGLGNVINLQNLKAGQAGLAVRVTTHPAEAALLAFGLYVAVAALALPAATLLTLAIGALFPFAEALLIVSFASSIGAALAFLGARGLFRESLRSRYRERLEAFDERIAREGARYLLSLRLVPLFPFFVVNVLAGLSSLRLRTFYLVSQIGMLPATAAYVYAGGRLSTLNSPRDVLTTPVLLALLAAATLPLLAKTVIAMLHSRRAYRGYKRPRQFDYNLIVIGAGSAGLVTSYLASAAGAKVALIERERMGGDCLNTGCVPSKALLHSARVAAQARGAAAYGVSCGQVSVDFAAVMQHVQSVIAQVEPHDSAERYSALGVNVIRGEATLRGPWQVEVDGIVHTARAIVLATGARPTLPENIDGLGSVDFVTSDTVWALRERPARLLVLGGGPIGCELAQGFARLGCAVTVVERGERLLAREDTEASDLIAATFVAEGIDVCTSHSALRVEAADGARGVLVCTHDGREVQLPFDRLLVALGRTPRTEGLGLEALGIAIAKSGVVESDGFLRTSMPSVHVAGDAAGPFQFTHVAAHQAWYAAVNSLLAPWWRLRVDYRVLPWATFTDPEVARVGLNEADASKKNIAVEVVRYGLEDLDRAITDGENRGFVKIILAQGSDRILGATIVGARAAELLAELVLAMKHGLGLAKVLGTIHVYPTYSEANRNAAGEWKRAHIPKRLIRLATRYFSWRRG